MNRHLPKENTQKTIKRMKMYLALLITREMQTKTTMNGQYPLGRLYSRWTIPNAAENIGKLEHPYTAARNVKQCNYLGKQFVKLSSQMTQQFHP